MLSVLSIVIPVFYAVKIDKWFSVSYQMKSYDKTSEFHGEIAVNIKWT